MIWILNVFFIFIWLEVGPVVWTWYWIITTLIVSVYLINRYEKNIANFFKF